MVRMRDGFVHVVTIGGTAAVVAALIATGCGSGSGNLGLQTTGVSAKAQLGRAIFDDPTLSRPGGQSCASCHQRSSAFTDSRQDSPTSEGAMRGRFGNRQTPTLKYMAFSPPFHFDKDEQDYVGGQFWDGRAQSLKDQVHFPMLNPAEMNNTNKAQIVEKILTGPLARSVRAIYGPRVFSDTNQAFDAIADAVAAFDSSPEFNPFTSKYDYYLKGKATLTPAESHGLALFNGKAGCANCHPSAPGDDGTPPRFTDFTYDNIGLPRNEQNRFFNMAHDLNPDGKGFVDPGLAKTTGRIEDRGRFKVPTLRNIAVTAPYFHNGVIKTLEQAVQFYNKRDLGDFGQPEVPDTMNREELGNLHLTDPEVADIVTFLQTLTDGYSVR